MLMLPQNADFLEILENNPFTPVEILFEDFYGSGNRTLKSVLDELDIESREQVVRILNTAGYEDII